jgi:hypothetical protein
MKILFLIAIIFSISLNAMYLAFPKSSALRPLAGEILEGANKGREIHGIHVENNVITLVRENSEFLKTCPVNTEYVMEFSPSHVEIDHFCYQGEKHEHFKFNYQINEDNLRSILKDIGFKDKTIDTIFNEFLKSKLRD